MQVIKADPDKLENFSSMMIALDPNNPGFVRMTGFSQGDGFSSSVLMVDSDASFEAINELFDLADKGRMPTGLNVSVVEADAEISWVNPAHRIGHDPHGDAIAAFIDEHLEPDRLDYLKRFYLTTLSGHMVNFLTTGETQRRWDTLRFMPLGTPTLAKHAACVSAIDQGDIKSLQLAMCDCLRWEPAALKSVLKAEKIAAAQIAADPEGERKRLARLANTYDTIGRGYMEHINSSQFPKDIEGVEAVIQFDRRCQHWSVMTQMNRAPSFNFARRISADMWPDAVKMLDDAFPSNAGDYARRVSTILRCAVATSRLQEEAPDLMQRVERAANSLWNEQAPDKADALVLSSFMNLIKTNHLEAVRDVSALLGDYVTLKELRSNSERWHQQLGTLDSKVLGANECISWRPLFGSVAVGENIRVVELTDTNAFERQGRLESHCVASYSPRVLSVQDRKATLIVSIERKADDAWKILSTAEIEAKIVDDGWGRHARSSTAWSMPQHKARYNNDPSAEAVSAAAMLMKRLEDIPVRDMKAYMLEMRTSGGELRRDLNMVIGNLRCNITMTDFATQALETHQNVLPKALRGLDVAGLVEEMVADPDLDKRLFRITAEDAQIWATNARAELAELEVTEAEHEAEP